VAAAPSLCQHRGVTSEGRSILGIDHVQIAIPAGGEDAARAFYGGLLGMTEIPKPAVMAARGGAWFVCGASQLHVGVESPFVPAKKAHPAFRMASEEAVRGLAAMLESQGTPARFSEEAPGAVRFHADDPFGNRLEFTAPI
jgi:catechol 2,3-dioxygenase-like lactoylglutathione lyase family enzyme